MKKKKKTNPALIALLITVAILLLIIAVLLILCAKLYLDNSSGAENMSYDNKVIETNDTSMSEGAYQTEYERIAKAMLNDGAQAEICGNLIIKVWGNAILEKQDPETDKYTMKDGKFVSDFSEAIDNLYNDESFVEDISKLATNQQQIKVNMKSMVNPPSGYEDEYQALKDMYDSYLLFIDTVLKCNGSLESFSTEFKEADFSFSQKYNTVELYMR